MMKSCIGIDIGADAVKLLRITKNRKGYVVKKAGYLPLQDIPSSEGMSREDVVVEAVRWLLAQNNISQASVCVGLSPHDVYTKYIKLPPVTADKIDQIVRFEARQQIPFPLEEVCWDYVLLGVDQTTGQSSVVLHAVKERQVEALCRSLEAADVSVAYVDVGTMALYNALSLSALGEGLVLLDIGKTATQLILVGEQGCWTRTLSVAGDRLTQTIVEDVGIAWDLAEQFKKTIGFQGEGHDRPKSEALEKGLQALCDEVRKHLDFYATQNPQFTMRALYLTGGNVRIPGLTDMLSKHFSASIEIFNPFHHFRIDPVVGAERLDSLKAYFATALGLALRTVDRCHAAVNLLPAGVLQDRKQKRRAWVIGLWAVSLAVIFGLYGFQQQKLLRAMDLQLSHSSKEIKVFEDMERQMRDLKKDIAPMEKKCESFAVLAAQKTKIVDTLLNLKKMTINDMTYQDMQIGLSDDETKMAEDMKLPEAEVQRKRKVRKTSGAQAVIMPDQWLIRGVVSDHYKKIDSLKIALESLPFVQRVDVSMAEEKEDQGRKKIQFQLKAQTTGAEVKA